MYGDSRWKPNVTFQTQMIGVGPKVLIMNGSHCGPFFQKQPRHVQSSLSAVVSWKEAAEEDANVQKQT